MNSEEVFEFKKEYRNKIPHYSQKVKKRKAKIGIKTTNVYQAKNYKPL